MKKNDPRKNHKIGSYEDIMFSEAGCVNECTGLIPKAVENQNEYESYESLMDFNGPFVLDEK